MDRELAVQVYPATQEDSDTLHWANVTMAPVSRVMEESQVGALPDREPRQVSRRDKVERAVSHVGRAPVKLGQVGAIMALAAEGRIGGSSREQGAEGWRIQGWEVRMGRRRFCTQRTRV